MVRPSVKKFFGIRDTKPTFEGISKVALVIVVFLMVIVGVYILFTPKELCAQMRDDIKLCHQSPWHGMTLEGELLNYTVQVYNYGEKPVQYALFPAVYFAADQNKTVPTPVRVNLEIQPGKFDFYRFYGQLDQGRWIISTTIQNATTSDRIYSFSSSIFVQPRSDFYNAVIAFGSIAGSAGTVSALFVLSYLSRKQIQQERAFRNEDRFETHSGRIARAIYDGCERGNDIFYTCSFSRGKFVTRTPRGPVIQWWPQAVEHFKSYPMLWSLREEAIQESEERCNELGKIYQKYRRLVLDEIKKQFPAIEAVESHYNPSKDTKENIRAFVEDTLLDNLFAEAFIRVGGRTNDPFRNVDGEQPSSDVKPGGVKKTWKTLLLSGGSIYHGSEEERGCFSQVVQSLMESKEVQNIVKEYSDLNNSVAPKEVELDSQRRIFWNDINDGVRLLGSCANCKGLI